MTLICPFNLIKGQMLLNDLDLTFKGNPRSKVQISAIQKKISHSETRQLSSSQSDKYRMQYHKVYHPRQDTEPYKNQWPTEQSPIWIRRKKIYCITTSKDTR